MTTTRPEGQEHPANQAIRQRAELGTTTASDLLRDRLLIVVGDRDADDELLSVLDGQKAGIVLSGQRDLGRVKELAERYPGVTVCAESDAASRITATTAQPFQLAPEHLFGGQSLAEDLDDQRSSGASFAVTPTGHIAAGDADTLKAVVELANELDREDTVVHLPCHWTWATPEPGKQLAAVIRRSRHPVALSLFDQADPLDHKGVPATVRQLASLPGLIAWRTDLAGFDHRANGGHSAAPGFLPSSRHGVEPRSGGRAIDQRDRTPKVLDRVLLRYLRGSYIEDRFANAKPPTCDCLTCEGRPLDRFSSSDADRREAHLHNVRVLLELHHQLTALTVDKRLAWWIARLSGAIEEHRRYSQLLRTEFAMPSVLKTWVKQYGLSDSD